MALAAKPLTRLRHHERYARHARKALAEGGKPNPRLDAALAGVAAALRWASSNDADNPTDAVLRWYGARSRR